MARDDEIYVYVGTYATVAEAQQDEDATLVLHDDGVLGTYDVALIEKDDDGKVRVHKHEGPTQHGVVVGALVGLLFGGVGVIAGGAIGGLVEHFRKGLSRADLKDLGDTLAEGEAGLVVIGKDELADQLGKIFAHAQRQTEKAVKTDRKDFEKAVKEASE